jgi:hypothetical protein
MRPPSFEIFSGPSGIRPVRKPPPSPLPPGDVLERDFVAILGEHPRLAFAKAQRALAGHLIWRMKKNQNSTPITRPM